MRIYSLSCAKHFVFGKKAGATLLVAAASVGLVSTSQSRATAQTIISTVGDETIEDWGNNGSAAATYGQVVTAPTGNAVLSSFTFTFEDVFSGSSVVPFQAYVYAWDSVDFRATGPALFSSTTLTAAPNTAFMINTGSTGVTAGNQYVLFFSTTDVPSSTTGSYSWFYNSNTASYSGGDFVFQNTSTFSDLTGTTWNTVGGDLRFSATFNVAPAAPEPGSIALVAGVLPVVGIALRRRRAGV